MKALFNVLFLVFTFASCDSLFEQECNRRLTVEYFVDIYPVRDTISVGDTLWMEMNIDNEIEDKETGEMLDISNHILYFTVFNTSYDIIPLNNSASHFDYHQVSGYYQFSSTRSFLAFDSPDNKKFKMGLIPKYSGGQVIRITILEDQTDYSDIELKDGCKGFINESSNLFVNEENQRNLHLLEGLYNISQSGDTLPWGTGEEVHRYTHVYAFYVEE